jgi:hypothetical protein
LDWNRFAEQRISGNKCCLNLLRRTPGRPSSISRSVASGFGTYDCALKYAALSVEGFEESIARCREQLVPDNARITVNLLDDDKVALNPFGCPVMARF